MSITAAMNSAASGLSAAGRAAQVVSDNVANALTPGYAARQITRSAGSLGGVEITSIGRRETQSLITDRRISEAALAGAQTHLSALNTVARAVGSADDTGSLAGRFADLSARLIEAQSRPDSEVRLGNLKAAFSDLVGHINSVGHAVQDQRLVADTAISNGVDSVNTTLQQVHDLNTKIVASGGQGRDTNALLDQRRIAVDRLAELIPIRTIPRDDGRIALITQAGKLILDGRPAEFSFTRTNGMSASMSLGAPLSGLEINGRPIDTASSNSPITGGTLAALFTLRDDTLANSQSQIDAVAQDLMQRLQTPSVDPTSGIGAPGILTDAGAAGSSIPSAGLAQRLAINAAVDPSQGGELYRLRDGLGATAPGLSGDASFLNRIADAFAARTTPTTTALTSSATDAGGMIDIMLAASTGAVFYAERTAVEANSRHEVFLQAELAEGVNTDDEMRELLLVEQSYAANARVIEVAGSMIQRLLEI